MKDECKDKPVGKDIVCEICGDPAEGFCGTVGYFLCGGCCDSFRKFCEEED